MSIESMLSSISAAGTNLHHVNNLERKGVTAASSAAVQDFHRKHVKTQRVERKEQQER